MWQMESKIVSNNVLLQTTDLEEFNKSIAAFGKNQFGFVTTGNTQTNIIGLDSKTFVVTMDGGSFLQQKGKLHLRNNVATSDLNNILKEYE